MRIFLIALTLVGTVACGTVEDPAGAPNTAPTSSSSRGTRNTPSRPQGELAPDFTVTTFEGEAFSLADRRGTPVVLNFWESW